MKQRVITAVVLLALLAVVVWQINTPVLVLVIAFLAAVAANEIMRCAKVENTFISVVATGYAACVPFFASAKGRDISIAIDNFALTAHSVLEGRIIRSSENEGTYIVGCQMPEDNYYIMEYVESALRENQKHV